MRLKIWLLMAALLGIAPASAQAPVCTGRNVLDELRDADPTAHASILNKARATENASAVLWKVERAGVPPSHLFGTMHLTDPRINALSPALRGALAGSKRLVLEVDDLSTSSMAKAFIGARNLVMFVDGRNLEQVLGEAEFRKVSDALARAGIPAPAANTFRPWVASLMLALSDCERQRTAAGQPALDLRLANEAKASGIPVAGLETLDLQFRAMSAIPEADQIELLKATVRLYERVDDLIETSVQLYLARQLGAIWPLQLALAEKVGIAGTSFASAEQGLLVKRNLGMRDNAVPHLAAGNAFIAVGALHLPGKHGLVSLLREAGYTVIAIE